MLKLLNIRFLLALILSVSINSAYALDPQKESQAKALFESLMSPFCPGRLLNDCPSSSAHELKEKIRERLEKGESTKQIEASLVAIYGEQIEASPSFSHFGIWAWLATPIFLLIGIALIFLWIKKKLKVNLPQESAFPALDSEIERRIKDEMAS